MKTKNGFNAYEEINALAREVLGDNINVEASIFGDDYRIRKDGKEILQGKSADIRSKLLSLRGEVLS